MDKKMFLSIIAAVAAVGLIVVFVMLMIPLVKPLAWALIIGIATYPHYTRITKRYPSPGRSAAIMVTLVTFCIILPMAGLMLMIAQNAADVYQQGQQLFISVGETGTGALSRFPFIERIISYAHGLGIDLSEHAAEIASTVSNFMINAATGAVKSMAQFIITLSMAIFILFFVYRDGAKIVDAGVRRFATNPAIVRHYLAEVGGTTTAVTIGTILTCIVQGALAGIGYFFAGLPAPIFCGIITAIAALVPVVGTAIVWVPLAAYLAITGAFVKAILLALWCIVFVGIADNAVRPLTIGAQRDIPTLAIIFGAIGGAATMGLIGLILGPILFAILVTVWRDVTVHDTAD